MLEILAALASGARIVFDSEQRPVLRLPAPEIDGPTWDALCREGWLEPMANGGTFKLSDAGLLSYLHTTDELVDGALISPAKRNAPENQP